MRLICVWIYESYLFVLFSEDKKWGHTAWRAHPRPRWGQITWNRHPIERTRTDACGIQHPRWWAGATTATTWRQCSAGALAVAIQVFDFISFISLTAFLCSGVSSQVEPGPPPPPSQLQSRFSIRSVLSAFNSILLQWCLFTHAISVSPGWQLYGYESTRSPTSRVILILKILLLQLLHGFKLFHLVSHFQNSFCFWCTTLPSAVCKIFQLQWEFQWENDQNQ